MALEFPHIPFAGFIPEKAKKNGSKNIVNPTRLKAKQNIQAHYEKLYPKLNHLNAWWADQKKNREKQGKPIPYGHEVVVKVDINQFDLDFLTGLGFELIAEEEDGYILVSINDKSGINPVDKIIDFKNEKGGGGSFANIAEIIIEEEERVSLILCDDNLRDIWRTIDDSSLISAEFSISCNVLKLPEYNPPENNEETEEEYQKYLKRYEPDNPRPRKRKIPDKNFEQSLADYDEKYETRLKKKKDEQLLLKEERFDDFIDNWINRYGKDYGYTESSDAFTVYAEVTGAGFKDIVRNYNFLFKVEKFEITSEIKNISELENDLLRSELFVYSPVSNAPKVCIIDSGIQEGHRLLEPAMLSGGSKCYIPDYEESNISDEVEPYGHGTCVAGCVLYGNEIPQSGEMALPYFLYNAKVLDRDCKIPEKLSCAKYIDNIVKDYNQNEVIIFNHSINNSLPVADVHISSWAESIDRVSYQKNVLFVQSVGNYNKNDLIKSHIEQHGHLDILRDTRDMKIASPAESLQAITVGSISHSDFSIESIEAIAGINQTSPFSRIGLGIWNSIKPEVVEYGGDLIVDKSDDSYQIRDNESTNIELVQSTMYGSNPVGNNYYGTSFAAPKIASIVANIQKQYPVQSPLLYRALLINSARWFAWAEKFEKAEEKKRVLQYIGYGIPDESKVIENNEYLITVISTEKEIHAGNVNVFEIPVPDIVRAIDKDYDIRIDVTLSYSAMPRRTRRRTKNYLSTWLDWKCSCKDESRDSFTSRIIESDDNIDGINDDSGYFDWHLRENSNWGEIKGISRQNSTVQKDWCYAKCKDLPEQFLIGVTAHKGWDKSRLYPAKYVLVVSFEIINKDLEIYNIIKNEIAIQQSQLEVERLLVK